jgi:hypothetical protein
VIKIFRYPLQNRMLNVNSLVSFSAVLHISSKLVIFAFQCQLNFKSVSRTIFI